MNGRELLDALVARERNAAAPSKAAEERVWHSVVRTIELHPAPRTISSDPPVGWRSWSGRAGGLLKLVGVMTTTGLLIAATALLSSGGGDATQATPERSSVSAPETPESVAVAPAAEVSDDAMPSVVSPEAPTTRTEKPSVATKERSKKSKRRSTDRPSRALSEYQLIQDMLEAANRGAHRRILRLAKLHKERFAQGALIEEARALEIEAYCQLGRLKVAERMTKRFEARFSTSVHLQRVRSACSRAREVPS